MESCGVTLAKSTNERGYTMHKWEKDYLLRELKRLSEKGYEFSITSSGYLLEHKGEMVCCAGGEKPKGRKQARLNRDLFLYHSVQEALVHEKGESCTA